MRNSLNIWILAIPVILTSCSKPKTVHICNKSSSPVIIYGVNRLTGVLHSSGYDVETCKENHPITRGIVILTQDQELDEQQEILESEIISGLKPDGFKLVKDGEIIYILSKTERGALYGIMDLIEQLGPSCDFTQLKERYVDPAFSFRAIKFNLPWSPYRPGPATDVHMETCRDLKFWESYLDMMVENRFNALSLWNTHPFPFMIRAKNYPKATPFNDEKLEEWRTFW